jgi:hypothetical protein
VTEDHRQSVLGAALASLWLLVVGVVDFSGGPDPTVVLAALYAIGPLIACALLPALPTAVFGGAAVLLAVASGVHTDTLGTGQQTVRMLDVVLISTASVVISWVRVRREHRYARVARIAEVAQRAVLPKVPARVGPVETAARYVSAVEDVLAGGDLFDCFHSDRHTCFVVGDVRGKGVGAVEQAARVIRAFRQAAAAAAPGDLGHMATDMSTYLAGFFDEEEFATATLLQVTDAEHLTFVSCGHPLPLLVRPSGASTLLDLPPGLPLGLGEAYEPRTLRWTPGDRLLLYTDGLSEARDSRGEFLPVEPLGPLLRDGSVESALDGLLEAVRAHVPGGRFTDDMAILLLENTGREAATSSHRDAFLVPREEKRSAPAGPGEGARAGH